MQVLYPFLNWIVWFVFGVELYKVFINFDINSLLDVSLADIFSHLLGSLFILLMVSFAV